MLGIKYLHFASLDILIYNYSISLMDAPQGETRKLDPLYDLIMDPDLAKNQWPAALDRIHQNKKHQSLMAKNVTKELFEKLKDVKSPSGWTLARAINTGTLYETSFTGCHAGDLESYELLKELFYPVIEAYHKGYKMDGSREHVTDMDSKKIATVLEKTAIDKIITTRIRVARNLSFFPLNPAGTKETRLQIADLMEKVVSNFTDDLKGTFYRHTDMTAEQTKELIDKHYLFRGGDKMQAASGYHTDWPVGRGIFVSKDEKFMMWINEGDHLRIISMETGGDVKSVFDRLSRGVGAVEENLKKITGRDHVFMSDKKMGMITCCPSNLGTGMRGSVHILLPKLIQKIGFDKMDELAREHNCQARGSTGEHSKVVDRIDISNWRRLGFPEYQLVEDMIKCANMFAKLEDQAETNPEKLDTCIGC